MRSLAWLRNMPKCGAYFNLNGLFCEVAVASDKEAWAERQQREHVKQAMQALEEGGGVAEELLGTGRDRRVDRRGADASQAPAWRHWCCTRRMQPRPILLSSDYGKVALPWARLRVPPDPTWTLR